MNIWLIGMSGAGKSTLAHELYDRLKPKARHLVLLDGDDFREIFGHDVDHTVEGRRKNAERISRTCQFLDRQGIHVIAAVLSIFPEWQAWNRDNFGGYFEIFLDLSLETLKTRDTKDLYAGSEAGRVANVVGVDIPFPRPPAPDLTIDAAMQGKGVEACVEYIMSRMPPLT